MHITLVNEYRYVCINHPCMGLHVYVLRFDHDHNDHMRLVLPSVFVRVTLAVMKHQDQKRIEVKGFTFTDRF